MLSVKAFRPISPAMAAQAKRQTQPQFGEIYDATQNLPDQLITEANNTVNGAFQYPESVFPGAVKPLVRQTIDQALEPGRQQAVTYQAALLQAKEWAEQLSEGGPVAMVVKTDGTVTVQTEADLFVLFAMNPEEMKAAGIDNGKSEIIWRGPKGISRTPSAQQKDYRLESMWLGSPTDLIPAMFASYPQLIEDYPDHSPQALTRLGLMLQAGDTSAHRSDQKDETLYNALAQLEKKVPEHLRLNLPTLEEVDAWPALADFKSAHFHELYRKVTGQS